MAQWDKDLALLQLGHRLLLLFRFDPWPGNFHMLQVQRKNKTKTLEENIGRTLIEINHSNIFFDLSPRIMTTKTKINQWDLIKFQRFCTAKETIRKRIKRQPTEGRKSL